MTDRELLELAAKAAGYALCTWPDESTLRAEIEPNWRPVWNPLESDGDALRLAARLGISISFGHGAPKMSEPPKVVRVAAFAGWSPTAEEEVAGDVAVAARRAIVRAAAVQAPGAWAALQPDKEA